MLETVLITAGQGLKENLELPHFNGVYHFQQDVEPTLV